LARVKVAIIIAVCCFCALLYAADAAAPLFSQLQPGQALPPAFRFIAIPGVKSNRISLVADDGNTVLKVESSNSAGSIGVPLTAMREDGNTTLTWRWKVDRVLRSANMATKRGDDFAARVYVFFDVPLESLSFMERSKIRMARAVAGADVPTAALCYVWDNTHEVGHAQWSPYTNRVRKIVLQSGRENINKWMTESRDVAADFKAAFGTDAPAVIGVAVGNDTDNTDEAATVWFGDIQFTKTGR
jgi:Protein of unknown function (DUF3047)